LIIVTIFDEVYIGTNASD